MRIHSAAFSFLIALSACGAGNAVIPRQGTALFDHFSYSGEDDYYNVNPLQEDDMFYNPILPGWYSDPTVCSNGEGDFFLATSSFVFYPGVPLFHSKDLVNWTQIGHILSRPSQLVNMNGQNVSGGIFAPALSYNPANKTYYMVTTNVGAGNFFVKTTDPYGEWSEPIMLPEVGGIDPSFFFDDDGKAYVINNDEAPDMKSEYDGHRTIRIQEFDVNNDRTVGPRTILVNKGANPEDSPIWIEGPHMYKINGKYYLMAAEGGTSNWHSEVIFRGDSPLGPFTSWEKNPILTQRHLDSSRSNPVTCAGHADLVKDTDGNWWATFLACRPLNGDAELLGRETFLMPVKWSDDGFPIITQGNDVVPRILKKEGVKRNNKVTFGNFKIADNFNGSMLSHEWMTLRGPADSLYSLKEVPGHLLLKCSDISASSKATPAFISRRIQHHNFTAETTVVFNPSEGEEAGLLLFKDETHQYFLAVHNSDKGKKVSLKKISKNGENIIASESIRDTVSPIHLKVSSTPRALNFFYSYGSKPQNDSEWKTLCNYIDSRFLSTAEAGGFTGTNIGMYACRKTKENLATSKPSKSTDFN